MGGFRNFLLVCCLSILSAILTHGSEEASIIIDTSKTVAQTDANYVCATIDWWPADKCDFDRCPWGWSSAINLNLSHPVLINAVNAFKTLRVRLGGSLQDQVTYDLGNLSTPCTHFRREKGGLFGFSKGCLHMKRWDELNNFFNKTGVVLTFGLNALHGRRNTHGQVWAGDWDSSNAREFINYTISKGYHVDSWEFGNELCGNGIGASVGARQYGNDSIRLKAMIDELYTNSHTGPTSLVAPGGFYDKSWFDEFLGVSGPGVVNAISHHLYSVGSGNDPKVMHNILDPHQLNNTVSVFRDIASTTRSNGHWASAWVSESGGIYTSGAKGVSNAFVNSFWYLDQLGMAAKYNTSVHCRQSLIGGFYGLLNKTTFVPNPDYYSSLLWHRLMGKGVLSAKSTSSPYLRVYAHCAKERAGGITVLLINLSNQTTYNVEVQSENHANLSVKSDARNIKKSFVHGLKRSVSWVGNKASDEKLSWEEYHLTPENGNLRSQTMLLNGQPLQLTKKRDIPSMVPILRDATSPVSISPYSIKFIVYPNFISPGCI